MALRAPVERTSTSRPRPSRRRVPTVLVLWAALAAVGAGWSLCVPLLAGPDEAAHVVKAAAVARGQLTGQDVERPGEYYAVLTQVQLPASYGDARAVVECYRGRPEVAASCAPAFGADDGPVGAVTTSVGRYPPLYYAVVGLPSLVLEGEAAVRGMLLVSGLVTADLLAVGAAAFLRVVRHPSAPVAVAAALTPMVLFLCGVVNPSSVEVAAGFATGGLLLPLVLDPHSPRLRRDLLAAAATTAVLVNLRPSSPLLAVLVLAVVAAVAPRALWQRALRGGAWRAPVAVGVVGTLAAVLWTAVADPAGSLGGRAEARAATPARALAAALATTPWYLQQTIGVFGWLDTEAPAWVYAFWVAVLAALGGWALLGTGWRGRAALLGSAVTVVALPALAQLATAERLGLIWQGRYLLPFVVVVPLLASALLAGGRAPGCSGPGVRRSASAAVVVLAAAHLAALVAALQRFSAGAGGSLSSASWAPPGGVVLPLALAAVGVGCCTAVLARAVRQDPT